MSDESRRLSGLVRTIEMLTEENDDLREQVAASLRAASTNCRRLHQLLDLYDAPPARDPAERVVALGEALLAAKGAGK